MTDETKVEKQTTKKEIAELGRVMYFAALVGIMNDPPTVENYETLGFEFHLMVGALRELQRWSEINKDLEHRIPEQMKRGYDDRQESFDFTAKR